jgi:large subunit ribosomal protein L14
MLQNFSFVHIADNTGASVGMVFRVLKGSGSRIANIGDLVVVTVKKSDPKSNVDK